MEGASITLAVISSFRPTVIGGQGLIALAVIILGRWNPLVIYLSCLIFGFLQAFFIVLEGLVETFTVSPHLAAMLPYVFSIVILIVFRNRLHSGPTSLGKFYVRST